MQITPGVADDRYRVEGTMDISCAEELCAALSGALERQQEVTLDLSGIESCDAAALQVLFAAKKTALLAQKRFGIDAPLPGALVQTAGSLGLPLEGLILSGDGDAV